MERILKGLALGLAALAAASCTAPRPARDGAQPAAAAAVELAQCCKDAAALGKECPACAAREAGAAGLHDERG